MADAVSHTILDEKSHGSLEIVNLYPQMSPARGGGEVLIFGDHVEREYFSAIFYEEEQGPRGLERTWFCILNHENWKSKLLHSPHSIRCKIPRYANQSIKKARQIFIQLHRPSDNVYSKPMPFKFVANDQPTKSMYACHSASHAVS